MLLPPLEDTRHVLPTVLGDRELCLEAGMDDYVTKPIRPDQLFETLRRFTH